MDFCKRGGRGQTANLKLPVNEKFGDKTSQILEIGVSPVMIIICTIWAPRGWLAAYVGFFVPVRFQIYKLNSNRRRESSFSSSTEQPARCSSWFAKIYTILYW